MASFADKNLGFSDRLNYAGANWRHLYYVIVICSCFEACVFTVEDNWHLTWAGRDGSRASQPVARITTNPAAKSYEKATGFGRLLCLCTT